MSHQSLSVNGHSNEMVGIFELCIYTYTTHMLLNVIMTSLKMGDSLVISNVKQRQIYSNYFSQVTQL